MAYSKRLLVLLGIILVSAGLFVLFPADTIFRTVCVMVMFLWLIPYISIRFILGESMASFGVQTGSVRYGVLWSIVSFVAAMIIFLLLFRFTGFFDAYEFPVLLQENFLVFVLYSLVMGAQLVVLEFFLRGVVTNGLIAMFGPGVVLFQFIILFFLIDVDPSLISWFIMAPFAGLTAYYSQSIYYSLATGFLFMVVVDTILMRLT